MRRIELLIGLSDLTESEHDSVRPCGVDGLDVSDLKRRRVERKSASRSTRGKLEQTHQLIYHLWPQLIDINLDNRSQSSGSK